MTKKRIIIIISIIISPILLIILARILSWYTFYDIPTTSMSPNIKIGDKLFGSSLITPKVNDVISYYAMPAAYENSTEEYLAVCRIVAKENDILEIKNGILYVNNIIEKDTLNLGYNFEVNKSFLNKITSNKNFEDRIYELSEKKINLNFSYNELIKLNILKQSKRILNSSPDLVNTCIFGNQYCDKEWSLDNFGPLKIPKDHYFLLGDNRSNSIDSRLRGFISKTKIIATIID
jgi:signal peptidase I